MAKYVKGQSGNPSGRPKQESARIRERLKAHADEIVAILMDKVRDGDSAALKMALDRISPTLKPTGVAVKMDADSHTLEALKESVIRDAIRGVHSTDALKDIAASIAVLARVEEVTALRDKLEAMERLLSDMARSRR